MGVLVRAICIVSALALTAAVADAPDPAAFFNDFLRAVSVAAPATLTTMMAWCALRRGLPIVPVPLQRALAWCTPAAITYVMSVMLRDTATPWTPVGHALAAFAIGAGIQHYYELR